MNFKTLISSGMSHPVPEQFMRILLNIRYFLNFGLEIWNYIHWKEEKILHNFSLRSFFLLVRYRAQSEIT